MLMGDPEAARDQEERDLESSVKRSVLPHFSWPLRPQGGQHKFSFRKFGTFCLFVWLVGVAIVVGDIVVGAGACDLVEVECVRALTCCVVCSVRNGLYCIEAK